MVSKIRLLECACIFSPGIFRQKSNEMSTGRITAYREAITLIELSLDQELSVVRCQFWVERWRAAELCLTHGEVIDIAFFGHSVFCLSEGSVDPAIGAPWNMESIPLGSTEFCILPIELFRSIGV